MKKYKYITVALIITLLLLLSCTKGDTLKNIDDFEKYEVIKIDSCEYIQWGGSSGLLNITHKGDCTNKIHKCK